MLFLKNLFVFTIITFVFISFAKVSHFHSQCSDEANTYGIVEHSHHSDHQSMDESIADSADSTDTAANTNECDDACPTHRVHSCGSLPAVTKNENIVLLAGAAAIYTEKTFSAKQSPFLDGPFHPPCA